MSFWKRSNFVSSSIKFYDYLVNDINCNYAWRCNKNNIFDLYRKNLESNHLEIGPGSGYFLLPKHHNKKIGNLFLMDINYPILNHSHNNLKNHFPNVYPIKHNIFENSLKFLDFQSVGINYVLHCVPGRLENKMEKLINNLPENLTIFGSTVINDFNKQTNLSQVELMVLNKLGIFNNSNDYSNALIKFAKSNKLEFDTQIIGNVLIFKIKV